jgi:hypothetical protein
MAHVRTDPTSADWLTALWRKDGRVVAGAMREQYFLAGGPMPYHDSDTTCFFLERASIEPVISALQEAVPRAGGVIENVFDTAEDDPRGRAPRKWWWPF